MDAYELSEKFMLGMRLATKRLIEQRAREDKSLIMADKEGNIQEVPAKQLLNNYATQHNWLNEENVIDV
ncbi:hypothetical protein [Emticicia fontis]